MPEGRSQDENTRVFTPLCFHKAEDEMKRLEDTVRRLGRPLHCIRKGPGRCTGGQQHADRGETSGNVKDMEKGRVAAEYWTYPVIPTDQTTNTSPRHDKRNF